MKTSNIKNNQIIILVGPTAVGKTSVSLQLAKILNSEIISADSMQVYKGLDIATAKPTKAEQKQFKHHLIDCIDIDGSFDVAQFREKALKAIEKIIKKGKTPLIVGGTGMYIKALTDGLFDSPSRDDKYRTKLEKLSKDKGSQHLHEMLKKIDPESAEKIHPKNIKRMIRALEVHHLTGTPISKLQDQWGKNSDKILICGMPVIIIGLKRPTDDLYARINKRVDLMFEQGLLKEAEDLIKKGIKKNKTAMQALGYKEVFSYLSKEKSLDEVKELLKKNSRNYAKRQMTWFRKDTRIKWINIEKNDTIGYLVKKIVKII